MVMMVGGDGEGSGKGGRQTSSKVIFDNFLGDLDDPGVQDSFSFYSNRSIFQAITRLSVLAILDCTHYTTTCRVPKVRAIRQHH